MPWGIYAKDLKKCCGTCAYMDYYPTFNKFACSATLKEIDFNKLNTCQCENEQYYFNDLQYREKENSYTDVLSYYKSQLNIDDRIVHFNPYPMTDPNLKGFACEVNIVGGFDYNPFSVTCPYCKKTAIWKKAAKTIVPVSFDYTE